MEMQDKILPYQPKNIIRILTTGSLFDGHDVAINIMRRIIQATGGEVIHLGHNRSVDEIVQAAIQEDVHGIAITSYQGGHLEFFKYTFDLLKQHNSGHIKIFGGGGGTILPSEIEELHAYGITRIYSPDDGRSMGLQGMINDLMRECDFILPHLNGEAITQLDTSDHQLIAQSISWVENGTEKELAHIFNQSYGRNNIWGVTGTGGAGKSSLVDEIILRFLQIFRDKTVAILSVDPSKRKSGGALLGDRIRMNAIHDPRVYMRSMATRQSNRAVSQSIGGAIKILQAAGFDLIILETSGIGQSDTEVIDHAGISTYVMTPEFGAASQLEKIDMLDFAQHVVINKSDKAGAADALRDVRKQYQRNHGLWNTVVEKLPVYPATASQFNDPGVNAFFAELMDHFFPEEKKELPFAINQKKVQIIPPARVRYLSEIAEVIRQYDQHAKEQCQLAGNLFSLENVKKLFEDKEINDRIKTSLDLLSTESQEVRKKISAENLEILENWDHKVNQYKNEKFTYQVRDKIIEVDNFSTSLSQQKIPKISLPSYRDWGDLLKWNLQENVPGAFPYTAGVFPFKRQLEDPTRMFAGEGEPERTNRRFHYVSRGMPAKRLSTAFDSVTLYGEDPASRPDIFGKVGNSGVSICTLDDAKKLYSGFNLFDPTTSVSMTINGPAATICAFFMHAAIDQQCELYIAENNLHHLVEAKLREVFDDKNQARPVYFGPIPDGNDGLGLMLLGLSGDQILPPDIYQQIKERTLRTVRGTVQADILKEDQAQNTCIFSTEFSLKLMGDTQQYFVDHQVQNFYSVSISGYHIAEAGANPISQLAFTLSNGFTFVEYYLSRGMHVDEFAPNLSFFFSNGIDPEYAVIGRVARRIWAKAMKYKYGANERSQKLKYHIQTSGRSLHAQEIDFNDIRTTLQALYAIYDNCNSLHTNAYDEAITTPTEESVRRAVAIQLIINQELGLAKNENPLQGSFIIEELTDLVEDAVLLEFENISSRGGVLGAMETMYQRSKIQEESLYYETLKHDGGYPIVGVNTFLSSKNSPTTIPNEVIRATPEEKARQIENLESFQVRNTGQFKESIDQLQKMALSGANLFEALMETVKYCSLGQITHALYQVGGRYRRNM